MRPGDLAQVEHIAGIVHPGYPEDAAVLAERLALFPAGCHVLDGGTRLFGYAISHPWLDMRPPALNRLLGAMPDPAGCTYIHDVALLPEIRGAGHGRHIVRHLLDQAGHQPVCLVAVGRSMLFWVQNGFQPASNDETSGGLRSYGPDAVFMRRG
jgi:GNAT superfamily N-acetyltransferase